ncbi:NUDIX hydrolase [Candidatus Pacearchaeota archaeon]|nr:NUDIX hydrolase [Candidatus Pacearchaeota archaeon]
MVNPEKSHDWKAYEKPAVTVDMVIFAIQNNELKVLLVKRAVEPAKGSWNLPGGFVRIEESLEEAAKRVLHDKTGVENIYLEQLYTFGDPKRDSRGRVITVSYFALVNFDDVSLKSSADVSAVEFFPVKKVPPLAFDHLQILTYALKRLKWKFEYTPVAFSLLNKKFTLSELQNLYEIVFDKVFDKRNFVKKILSLDILKTEEVKKDVSHRPPMLYSLKKQIPEIIEII